MPDIVNRRGRLSVVAVVGDHRVDPADQVPSKINTVVDRVRRGSKVRVGRRRRRR